MSEPRIALDPHTEVLYSRLDRYERALVRLRDGDFNQSHPLAGDICAEVSKIAKQALEGEGDA